MLTTLCYMRIFFTQLVSFVKYFIKNLFYTNYFILFALNL